MARSLCSTPSTDFRVKWFVDDEARPPVAVCLQGHCGPCPLLALANTLLLRRTLVMPENVHSISNEHLLGLLTDLPAATHPDILDVLPKLASSVAVDVCFSGTTDFAPSAELSVFDTFRIRVLHGWIPDPHDDLLSSCISPLSYNQVCDQLVFAASSPMSDHEELPQSAREGIVAAVSSCHLKTDTTVEHTPSSSAHPEAPRAADNIAQQATPGTDLEVRHVTDDAVSSPAHVPQDAPCAPVLLPHHLDIESPSIYAVPGLFDDDSLQAPAESANNSTEISAAVPVDDTAAVSAAAIAEETVAVSASVVHVEGAPRPEDAGEKSVAVSKGAMIANTAEGPVPESSLRDNPPTVAGNALIVQGFLQDTSAMLTHFGLTALHETVFESEYAVLFFNNHFTVLTKHDGHLFMLVTDAGYAAQPSVIWERLIDVDGNTTFFNATFRPASVKMANADRGQGSSSTRPATATHPKPVPSSPSTSAPAPPVPGGSRLVAGPPTPTGSAKRPSGRKGDRSGKGCSIQ